MSKPLWVTGWLAQLLLLAFAVAGLWKGLNVQASVFVTGSLVIGVMRQIEKERRASTDATTSPTPRSKV